MRIALLASLVLFSVSSLASTASLSATPKSPVVISSDMNNGSGAIISGPWFDGRYLVRNEGFDDITITGMDFKVTSMEGRIIRLIENFISPVQLRGGSTFDAGHITIGSLPASDSFVYTVDVTLHGWTGAIDRPGEPLATSIQFVTQ